MSYARRLFDNTIDTPLLYKYLTMNVEDAEYPTAVPFFALVLVAVPTFIGLHSIGQYFGLFSNAHQHHSGRAYLDIDGIEEACDGCKLQ